MLASDADVDCALARAVMDGGAHAVIMKSSPVVDAVATLVQVMHGRTSFPATDPRPARRAPGAEGGLSRRQLEVLEQLALGRSNDEIARELYISTNTVKFHLRVIYERLGVKNRVEAARLLMAGIRPAALPTRPGGSRPARGGGQPPDRAIPGRRARA